MAEQSRVSRHPRLEGLKACLAYLNTAIQGFVNLVLVVAGISCLVFGTLSLWKSSDAKSTGAALAAGLVLLLASSIDRFEVLKGLGIEARTRKLDAALTQANATIEQLQELAELSGQSIVSLTAGVGRWDSATTPRAAHETVQRVRRNLQSLNTTEEAIRRILAPWVKTTLIDLLQCLTPILGEPLALVRQEAEIRHRGRIDSGSAEYQASLDRLNSYGSYEGRKLGHIHDSPVETWSSRIRDYVEGMPIADAERARLLNWVSPWLIRMDYLTQHNDLSEKEEWFAMLERAS